MRKRFNHKLNKTMYEIFAGEYYATAEKDVVLATLLGSCVSVCLKDHVSGVTGINHIMLPGIGNSPQIIFTEDARYGLFAMEMLINNMMKLGAYRNSLRAKVFGGANVLGTTRNNIAKANIDFVFSYLEMEKIPIESQDVGGQSGRKIYFFSDSFDIYLKRINKTQQIIQTTMQQEKQLLQKLRKKKMEESELTLFD